MDLTDILQHHTQEQQNVYSSVQRIVSRIDHMLDHKTNLIKCKKVKIISDMLSNHSEIKLKYSNRNLGNSQI